jgi:hypothetical protein
MQSNSGQECITHRIYTTLRNACKLKFRIAEINTWVFIKCTETNYHNYEISTMWETETRTNLQKSARLLNGARTVPKS